MNKTSIVAASLSAMLLCGGMVMAQSAPPQGWTIQGSKPEAYVVKADSTQKSAHGNSVSLQSIDEKSGTATLMQAVKADDYKGKRVRFSGYIKGQGVKSWAGLWMRVNAADNRVTSFDNMEKRAFRGNGDWKKFEVVLDVPADSATISFGAIISGLGQIWVSGLEFQVVDESVSVTAKPFANELNSKPVNLELN